jgi:hypothetical protein
MTAAPTWPAHAARADANLATGTNKELAEAGWAA